MVLQRSPELEEQTIGEPLQDFSKELTILLGRKNRDKWRGDYKQRDRNDISTRPPKPKKPKVENADYWYCFCWKKAISKLWVCAEHY